MSDCDHENEMCVSAYEAWCYWCPDCGGKRDDEGWSFPGVVDRVRDLEAENGALRSFVLLRVSREDGETIAPEKIGDWLRGVVAKAHEGEEKK